MPLSMSIVDVRLTWTYDVLLLLRPNMQGDPTTQVMLSIIEGKFGSSTSRKTKVPGLYVHGEKKEGIGLEGNSNGVVGKHG